jgi:hypothetical protein
MHVKENECDLHPDIDENECDDHVSDYWDHLTDKDVCLIS